MVDDVKTARQIADAIKEQAMLSLGLHPELFIFRAKAG
jgi:hypothetical protein